MSYFLLVIALFGAALQPSSGFFFSKSAKKECPLKPPGISSFRPAPGTRLYYAWSTVQGSAKASFLSNSLCRGGRILDCSCIGYDVTGYDRNNVETQEGFTFSVNKKQGVGDLYRFTRTWTNSADYHLKCHYTTDYQYGSTTKHRSPYSHGSVWTRNNATAVKIDKYSNSLKVLSWTSTEVVFYDCSSRDPDVRIYTTYQPTAKSIIPYSVFDVLSEVGININALRWLKLDHRNCVYPKYESYAKLISKKKY
ncbi:hypothetical protein M8J76_001039 [Diaphorina citri]|nr:hypothetical protein M8J75_013348 [Diaphorina citri]KAI5744298.1 hypothetical protein M8J76_001039 [Diaphorina citri]KAI5753334.1 hypothetical protein M8J77_025975 [Diaphorina citri]